MEALSILLQFIRIVTPVSAAAAATCAFVLFLPEGFAEQMRIIEYRQQYLGGWWMAFIFTTVLSIISMLRWSIAQREQATLEDRTRQHRLDEKREHEEDRRQREEEARQRVLNRTKTLSVDEKLIIAYCLLEDRRSFTVPYNNALVNGLRHRGVLTQGGGTLWSVVHTFPDDIWEHFQERRDEFLPTEKLEDSNWVRSVRSFGNGQSERF